MPDPGRIHIELDLDLGAQPIEGEVRTDSGELLPFQGWLGLTAALERAGDRDGDVPDPRPEREADAP